MANLVLDSKNSLLTLVKNSVGSNLFRNIYFKNDQGQSIDILRNGDLSCAVFVSYILYLVKLINDVHATVKSAVLDLEKSGWQEIKELKEGAILVWQEQIIDKEPHQHIGFYIGNNQAISSNYKMGSPQVHHWTFENSRPVTKIFWNNKLD